MGQKRDLIIFTKKLVLDEDEIVRQIQSVLVVVVLAESMAMFCTVNEVIDINRYKIINAPHLIYKTVTEPQIVPFVFVFNKN